MSTEHRKAPRRKVKEIRRVGTWGKVMYEHVLECGHTETRNRKATVPKIACAWCLRTSAKEIEIRALANPAPLPDDYDSQLLKSETEIDRVRAKIAHEFRIPLEQVDVASVDVTGKLQISGAVIWLSASEVRRITDN